jgi:hypothetical protein
MPSAPESRSTSYSNPGCSLPKPIQDLYSVNRPMRCNFESTLERPRIRPMCRILLLVFKHGPKSYHACQIGQTVSYWFHMYRLCPINRADCVLLVSGAHNRQCAVGFIQVALWVFAKIEIWSDYVQTMHSGNNLLYSCYYTAQTQTLYSLVHGRIGFRTADLRTLS